MMRPLCDTSLLPIWALALSGQVCDSGAGWRDPGQHGKALFHLSELYLDLSQLGERGNMGAATGNGDLLAFQRAVPVARIDDRLSCAAEADFAPCCDPVGQLLVGFLFNQRQICQQRLAVDPFLA